ncbi:MAG: hypothetical protein LQ338_002939 [Usnochroma carphineum]|nr:MAG: hypothetical protein LQ338_002939 [Usnochroma carphineum]
MPSEKSSSSTHSTNSDVSNVSESSTVLYSQVPFDEYVPTVRKLCQKLWPSTAGDYDIERLKGGSYNRIIAITTPSSTGDAGRSYILRVPRFDEGQQERELAIHRYVREHTSIPLANIVFSDPTSGNPLGSPYVVQTRLSGTNLVLAYRSLTYEQQKAVLQDFAKILLALQAVKNRNWGIVEATAEEDGNRIYSVCRFDITSNLIEDVDDVDPSSDPSVLNMLLTQFKRWLAYALQLDPDDILSKDYYAQLSKIAREMDEAGLFEDNSFYLTHLDLEPRNMLVEIGAENAASISGVLDWDSAVFAPIFASCKPPSWIWAWDEEEDEDERKANDVPPNPEQRELKQIFEEIMGPAYLKYAYEPQYRMARWLFNVAIHGLGSSSVIEEAEHFFKEWAEFTGSIDSPDAFIGIVADNVAALSLDQGNSDRTEEDGGEYSIDADEFPGLTEVASVCEKKLINEDMGEETVHITVEDAKDGEGNATCHTPLPRKQQV